MKLLFTKSTLLGGKQDLITWGLDEPCSHFAISFFDDSTVFQSDFLGVGCLDAHAFYANRNDVFVHEFKLTPKRELEIFKSLMTNHNKKDYDWPYFWWLVIVGIKYKIFGIAKPTKVKKQNAKALICHEVIDQLPKSMRKDVDFCDCITPYSVYLKLKEVF